MICHLCGKDKLSEEFPHEHLTDICFEHALLHCLRVSMLNYQYSFINYICTVHRQEIQG